MTPRSNADRVKTDRRDCLKLCRLARAGELTPIHVPDEADEAMRDLVRAREDAVVMQRQVRQRLGALLLRNDVRYNGKTAWSPAHRRRIAELKLPHAAQHIAFEEYAQGVDEAGKRIERLETAIGDELTRWRWRPVVAVPSAPGAASVRVWEVMSRRRGLRGGDHPPEGVDVGYPPSSR